MTTGSAAPGASAVGAPPTPAERLGFLVNLGRLLSEGSFVATYEYALLIALAELAVERGDDSGAEFGSSGATPTSPRLGCAPG